MRYIILYDIFLGFTYNMSGDGLKVTTMRLMVRRSADIATQVNE